MTVTNAEGCRSTTQQTITIKTTPTASFEADVSQLGRVNFRNTSVDAQTYRWVFGDGTTSTASDPTVVYNANGTRTVKLVVCASTGCCDSTTKAIQLTRVATHELPEGYKVNISPNPFSQFLNLDIQLPLNPALNTADELRFYDVLGRKVHQIALANGQLTFSTSDWVSGIYRCILFTSNKPYWIGNVVKMAH